MKNTAVFVMGSLFLAGCQSAGGGSIRQVSSSFVTTPTKPQQLVFATSIHPDCTSAGKPEVRVVTGPQNGRLEVVNAKDYPRYLEGNQRYHCNARTVDGVRITYTPRSDFIGTETIVTDTFYPNGEHRRNTFMVIVR